MSNSVMEQNRWIRTFHPSPESQLRLFCFPFAGGAASYYFPYSTALSPRYEVQAIQYPGRQERRKEPCLENIGEMAGHIYEVLRDTTDRPYAFFGHSMGAVVAYEVARNLYRDGLPGPRALFVSGRRAPSRHRAESVCRRDDDGLVAELRTLGGTDPRWLDDPELLATILPPIRSDYRAIEAYRHLTGPLLECPVTALTGDADPYASVAEVVAWQEHSTGPFSLRVFKGGHFFLDSYQQEVLDLVSCTLDEMLSPTLVNRR